MEDEILVSSRFVSFLFSVLAKKKGVNKNWTAERGAFEIKWKHENKKKMIIRKKNDISIDQVVLMN